MKVNKWFRSLALTLAVLLAAQGSPLKPFAQEVAMENALLRQQMQQTEADRQQQEISPSEISPDDIVGEMEEKREPNVKHFLLESGQMIAVTYPETVHELVDGQWEEIDNSLQREPLTRSSDGNGEISNQAVGFQVSFSEGEGNQLIKIQKDSSVISWNLRGAGEKNLTVSQPDDTESENPFAIKNIKSSGTYQGILPGTDIQYTLDGTTVKENIVVQDLASIRNYQFDLECQNASAVLNEDKSITFQDGEGNVIFTMQAPVMYDAIGEYSDAIEVRLTATEGGYLYELIPDGSWMGSADRVYPITIDPTVETEQNTSGVQSTYIKESMPTTRLRNEARIWVGSASARIPAACRALIKVTLPTLTPADYVTSTYLQLTPIATHYLGWNSDGIDKYYFTAHRITSNWDPSTVTWNTQPEFDPSIVDYKMALINNYDYNFNITEIAKEWYNTGVNTGLELQLNQEEGFCFFGEFGADSTMNDDASSYPVLYITYMNTAGMESFWTYQTTSAGEAGSAFVQNHTGHLTYAHDDLGLDGNIMPVAISHVYNSTYKSENLGYGLGWQTNYDQTVKRETIGDRTYYIYRDSDGTKHAFDATETKEEYEDSSGLELKLKIDTGSSDARYVITDKDDSKLNFDQNGALKTVCNARNQKITVTRDSGGKILSIADGSNRTFAFAYENGNLSTITTPDGRQQRMSYTNGQLTGIGYSDTTSSNDTTFTYGNQGLTSAQSRFGDRVDITYNANGNVTQLTGSYVNGETVNKFSQLSFDYSIKETKVTDHKGRKTTYQFNEFGNTKCIYNDEGQAQFYKYYAPNDSNPDGDGEPYGQNKVEMASDMQKVSCNLLQNNSFEEDGYWTGGSYSTQEAYEGNRSYCLTGSGEGEVTAVQHLVLNKGDTYVLSAYVKNEEGEDETSTAGLSMEYKNASGAIVSSPVSTIDMGNGWQRISVTITLPTDASERTVDLVLHKRGTGNAYFDCIQVEEGTVPNRFNLMANPDFYHFDGGTPWHWSTSNGYGMGWKDEQTEMGMLGHSYCMKGAPKRNCQASDTVQVKGEEGTTLNYGGWILADSAPELHGEAAELNDITSLVRIQLYNGGQEVQSQEIKSNTFCDEWQFVGDTIVAKQSFDSVKVTFEYKNNVNDIYIDGAFLYKDHFGQSYRYDEDGNIISTTAYDKQESTFEYDADNDMIKSTNPKGASYTYQYNDYHEPNVATSAEGVDYSYYYGEDGNILQSQITTQTSNTTGSAAYTEDGQYLTSQSDVLGNAVSYTYNEDGTVHTVTDAKGVVTTYTYDDLQRVTQVETTNGDQSLSNQYGYTDDRMTSVTHNGFQYLFEYDQQGRISATYVADGNGQKRFLSGNLYTAPVNGVQSGLVETLVYGNQNTKHYTYDRQDRVVGVRYDTDQQDRYTYEYDSEGLLHSQTDTINDITVTYEYDLSKRLSKIHFGSDYILQYHYDINNNLTKVEEIYGTDSQSTRYLYNQDDLVTQVITASGGYVDYDYSYDRRQNLYTKENLTGNADTYGFTGPEGSIAAEDSFATAPVKNQPTVTLTKSSEEDAITNYGSLHTTVPRPGEQYTISFWYKAQPGTTGTLRMEASGEKESGEKIVLSDFAELELNDQNADGQYRYFEGCIEMEEILYDFAQWVSPTIQWTDGTGTLSLNAITFTNAFEDIWTPDGLSKSRTNNGGISTIVDSAGSPVTYDNTVKWEKTGSGNQWHGTYDAIRTNIPQPHEIWEISFYAKLSSGASHNTMRFQFNGHDNIGSLWAVKSTWEDIQLKADNQWHKYSVQVTMGENLYNEGTPYVIPYLYWDYSEEAAVLYLNGVSLHRVDNAWTKNRKGQFQEDYTVENTSSPQITQIDSSDSPVETESTTSLSAPDGQSHAAAIRVIDGMQGGQTWTMSFWAKFMDENADHTSVPMQFDIRSLDLFGSITTLEDIPSITVPNDSQWHFYTMTATIAETFGQEFTEGGLKVWIKAVIPQQGTLLINGIQLNPGDAVRSLNHHLNDGSLRNSTINTGSYQLHSAFLFDVDSLGREITRIKHVIQNNQATSYEYDMMGHISRIYLPDGKEISYSYDDLGQLIRENNGQAGQTVVYTYDNAGNILQKESYAYTTGDVQPGSGTVVEYGYQDDVWKDLLTYQSDIGSIEYDAIGNPLRYGQWILTWEAGRQLKSIISKSGLNLSFTYGENGLRTSKTSEETHFTYQVIDGVMRSLTKSNGMGQETLTFQYSGDAVLSVTYQGEEYWYIKNMQGDVIGLMDKNGQMVVTYTYDSWGVPLSREGSMKDTLGLLNPFRYREYIYDEESGLYYLESRYYDPRVGRFLNADIVMASNGDFPSCSVFSYCSNDPVDGYDPSGMSEFQDNYMRWQRDRWGSGKQQEYERAKLEAYNRRVLHPNPVRDVIQSVAVVGKTISGKARQVSRSLNMVVSHSYGISLGSMSGSLGVSTDLRGSVAIQVTFSGGVTTSPEITMGNLSFSHNMSIINAPTVSDLEGMGEMIGGATSVVPGVFIGGDFVAAHKKDGGFYGGASLSGGATLLRGNGSNVHVTPGYTVTLWEFNVYDAVNWVYDSILGW